jgi:hypothetical protein
MLFGVNVVHGEVASVNEKYVFCWDKRLFENISQRLKRVSCEIKQSCYLM